jgi:hemoglobin
VKPLRVTCIILAVAALAACAPHEAAMAPAPARAMASPPPATLYQRLGGTPAITVMVDDFVDNAAQDRRIRRYFRHTDITQLKVALAAQICEAARGPCRYAGPTMREAHRRRHITNRAFDELVDDFRRTLDRFRVPPEAQTELLHILAAMRKDIVNV